MSYVTAEGTRLHYRVDGEGDPVVLIHGFGRTLEDWAQQHELLKQRFRVYSLDLPGFGDSHPLREPYTLKALGRSVIAFLEAARIDKPIHLVGNSMGGAVTMTASVEAPHRVRSLLLTNSAGFSHNANLPLRLLGVRPLAALIMCNGTLGMARGNEKAFFFNPVFATEERTKHTYIASKQPHTIAASLALTEQLLSIRGQRAEWRLPLLEALNQHRVPTLVMWGDHDKVLRPSDLDAATHALPYARTQLISDAGHMPMIEKSGEFARLAVDFWQDVAADRAQC
ncbi:alpha/beta fold hydrolase [Kribbella sp. NPDC051587]|uniref:alpha/beta fold hydrolase n=1 Tax=Kribbella sp. NPDC051587 TaxID=3364119 RepID=UPI0037A7461C